MTTAAVVRTCRARFTRRLPWLDCTDLLHNDVSVDGGFGGIDNLDLLDAAVQAVHASGDEPQQHRSRSVRKHLRVWPRFFDCGRTYCDSRSQLVKEWHMGSKFSQQWLEQSGKAGWAIDSTIVSQLNLSIKNGSTCLGSKGTTLVVTQHLI